MEWLQFGVPKCQTCKTTFDPVYWKEYLEVYMDDMNKYAPEDPEALSMEHNLCCGKKIEDCLCNTKDEVSFYEVYNINSDYFSAVYVDEETLQDEQNAKCSKCAYYYGPGCVPLRNWAYALIRYNYDMGKISDVCRNFLADTEAPVDILMKQHTDV